MWVLCEHEKSIKRFLVRNVVEQAVVRDVQEACVSDGARTFVSLSLVTFVLCLFFVVSGSMLMVMKLW